MVPATTADRYFLAISEEGLYRNTANLRLLADFLFDRVPVKGKRILDIGGGNGRYSFLAAAMGAAEVVCMEPCAAGSGTAIQDRFNAVSARLGTFGSTVRLDTSPLQEFNGETPFDVVMIVNSVNHLNEPLTSQLHCSEPARQEYRQIFRKIYDLTAIGGHLLALDASRHNIFRALHPWIRNPLCPTIQWEKHQPPGLWAKLLEDVGFETESVTWKSPNTLRRPGRLLLGNALTAYFLTSEFRLVMRRPHKPPST